jgi:DnaJ-class molecular chaperone
MGADKGATRLVPCEKCKGTGFTPSPYRLLAMIGYVATCDTCDGVGKVEKAA